MLYNFIMKGDAQMLALFSSSKAGGIRFDEDREYGNMMS